MSSTSVSGRGCPYFDPEYDTLSLRLDPPSVVIDNTSCPDATLIKVDSKNKHGILLEVVQVLTDLDLAISKAYISSDGGWFMDVFHVTDQLGNKLTDEGIIDYIQQSLGAKQDSQTTEVQTCLGRRVSLRSNTEQTAIELCGRDRPGLLSDISGVLKDMMCNVVAAEVWTHNLRVACVVYVTDEVTGGPIEDEKKLAVIKARLSQALQGDESGKGSKTDIPMAVLHTERRLHQIMSADFAAIQPESTNTFVAAADKTRPAISVQNCAEKGYSVVNVRCNDRPKLLFDTVCTLTDMKYVVFHAAIRSEGSFAYQEYYIRLMDGCTLKSEAEQEYVVKCLEAAIERRTGGGIRLELCTKDRVGLLSDVTRIFRENGLSVTRADVSTQGDKAVNVFYVTDASGNPVDRRIVEATRKEIGQSILQVKDLTPSSPNSQHEVASKSRFSFGTFLYSLGLINSQQV
ncbi:ACT domain-containing protein ACR3 isoform X2 [Selaginella moellendorffii]|uniref:ACT domain-containing protein ACR3 isoform X2 n=1 Tax=Selaginella moellendorffii TaxID=88036 RepID=UPI000D1CE7FD|nr:ACT domain-containing protein ACR3 isoform X2 [Selaginella moellendorffii]|eukprot:XP_024539781.1 ACT domain-containing protein ACR3 isoform X2 [Selaginella moellendorffii]